MSLTKKRRSRRAVTMNKRQKALGNMRRQLIATGWATPVRADRYRMLAKKAGETPTDTEDFLESITISPRRVREPLLVMA